MPAFSGHNLPTRRINLNPNLPTHMGNHPAEEVLHAPGVVMPLVKPHPRTRSMMRNPTRRHQRNHATGSHVLDLIHASMSSRFNRKSLPDLPIAYATSSPFFTAARI